MMSNVQLSGYPLPRKPERPIEAELERLRNRTIRLEKAELGALAGARDALGVLANLIQAEARAAEDAAELEWTRADRTAEGAAAIKAVVPDGASTEVRQAAASQARRRILALRKQSGAHNAAAQSWETRSAELRAAAFKLAAKLSAPVAARPSAPRGPMLDAIAEINASMAGGAK
jgi:hypothetical protein